MNSLERFREIYCANRGITCETYPQALFSEALYPHARYMVRLLKLIDNNYFTSDYDFINNVGLIMKFKEFENEAAEFTVHPRTDFSHWNRCAKVAGLDLATFRESTLLRRWLRLRVSSHRLRRIVRAHLRPVASPIQAPVEAKKVTTTVVTELQVYANQAPRTVRTRTFVKPELALR